MLFKEWKQKIHEKTSQFYEPKREQRKSGRWLVRTAARFVEEGGGGGGKIIVNSRVAQFYSSNSSLFIVCLIYVFLIYRFSLSVLRICLEYGIGSHSYAFPLAAVAPSFVISVYGITV